jgi:hypothetical protein
MRLSIEIGVLSVIVSNVVGPFTPVSITVIDGDPAVVEKLTVGLLIKVCGLMSVCTLPEMTLRDVVVPTPSRAFLLRSCHGRSARGMPVTVPGNSFTQPPSFWNRPLLNRPSCDVEMPATF